MVTEERELVPGTWLDDAVRDKISGEETLDTWRVTCPQGGGQSCPWEFGFADLALQGAGWAGEKNKCLWEGRRENPELVTISQ